MIITFQKSAVKKYLPFAWSIPFLLRSQFTENLYHHCAHITNQLSIITVCTTLSINCQRFAHSYMQNCFNIGSFSSYLFGVTQHYALDAFIVESCTLGV